jgi:hypothetical protein
MQPCPLLFWTLLTLVRLVEGELFLALFAVLMLMVQSIPNTQEYVNHNLKNIFFFSTLCFPHALHFNLLEGPTNN